MRIGVLSDTHDQLGALDAAIAYFRKKEVAHVLHAGDFVAPFSVKRLAELGCPVTAVFGNNDGERFGIRKAFGDWGEVHERCVKLELGGRRIVMMHEPDFAEEAARSGLYDLVIHGHTHEVGAREVGECIVLNPGSCGGVPDVKPTVALVDLDSMKVKMHEL